MVWRFEWVWYVEEHCLGATPRTLALGSLIGSLKASVLVPEYLRPRSRKEVLGTCTVKLGLGSTMGSAMKMLVY